MNQFSIRYFWKVVKLAVITIAIILFIRSFIIDIGIVNGRSMEPAYIDSERFLVNKIGSLIVAPSRGDVVQIIDETNDTVYIKRIIGLPGERVKLSNNQIFIITPDGKEFHLSEPYIADTIITKAGKSSEMVFPEVGEAHYFVMGDNREQSLDSRDFGAVPRWRMYGTVIQLFRSLNPSNNN